MCVLSPLTPSIAAVQVPQATRRSGDSTQQAERHACAAATSRCEGEIRVPLNWSDPASEEITVAFLWLPRSDTTRPAAGTILLNPGGPQPAIPAVPRYENVLGPLLEHRNLLVVDPRGLGKSSPLRCPGLDLYDDQTIAACARALGPRVQYFTTDQVVADMDAVRAQLGVDKVSFYGNSYGTVYAHAYATRFPDRTESVYFDSVVRIDENGYVREPIHSGTEALELVCSRSPTCDALSGTATSTLERVIDALRAEPDPEVRIGAMRMLRVGGNLIGMREGVAAANAYLAGDPAPLRRLMRGFGSPGDLEFVDAEMAGEFAIRCGDSRFPYDREAEPEERHRQLERFYAFERPLAPFEVSDILGFRPPAAICVNWPTPRESPPVPADASYPSIPVLAVGGDFDTESPADVAQLIGRFPQSTVVPIRYGTHALALGASSYADCVRDLMRNFLADPRHPAPTPAEADDCDGESFRAIGSFPQTVADVPAARSEDLSDADRRLVAAVFATVADAVARRNPNDALWRPATETGLRGGKASWDAETRTLTAEDVRFVADLAVTGKLHVDADHRVTAELHVVGPDRQGRDLVLWWRAFVAENNTDLAGQIDGSDFTAQVPLH